MSIQLTSAALERMQKFMANDPNAVGVRLGIKRTGCSGYSYTVELARSVAESDHVFDREGVRVLVAQDTIAFVEGTEIDYQRQGINAAFVFRNPNATGECGCGESFTVDARA